MFSAALREMWTVANIRITPELCSSKITHLRLMCLHNFETKEVIMCKMFNFQTKEVIMCKDDKMLSTFYNGRLDFSKGHLWFLKNGVVNPCFAAS